ncbi:MAG: DNA methyltransferase [Dehalococcoidales bacterium]|nr:DNA methyltransferase [Dehalococcoidales bacterium]
METNVIYCGDCLIKLKEIPDESIDLIYIDPPFSSNRNYVAFWQEQEKRHFEDRFENVRAYLNYMEPRIKELYRILSPKGSFYYHCDWHASHYIKMLLDRDDLFGYSNFLNEIVWHYRRWTGSAQNFLRMHDTILFYAKEKGKHRFNPAFTNYTKKSLARKQHYHTRIKGDDVYVTSISPTGVKENDVWDIPVINSQAKERLGYPTQKPLALLDRIIKASSNEGDIVLDAFCGCGTTIISAQLLKRQWIGIDVSPTSCRVMAKRLQDSCGITEGIDFWIKDLPKTVEELRIYPAFEFQNWAVNALGGVPNKIRVRDKGIDGKLYPIEDIKKEKKEGLDLFGDIDRYIPIQVKRTDQVGRPDIENFEVAMKRDKREKGIFIGFDFSRDALQEIRRAEREESLLIEPKTVSQIVEDQLDKSLL